jgi:hypothetical protein
MPLTLRSVKGTKLSIPEMDNNLLYLVSTLSGSVIQVTGSSMNASNTSITASAFVGDGSKLTGVTGEWDGSHVGDASITGSLIVTSGIKAVSFTGSLLGNSLGTASYATFAATSSYFQSNDGLEGTVQRTIFARNSDTTHTSGTDTDFLSGSVVLGSRAFPSGFLTNSTSFSAKILHFRTVGKFASGGGNDTNFSSYLSINNQILPGSDLGNQTLSFSNNKPFEILGEIIITAGSSSCCYAIKYCDNQGDLRAFPLGDVTVSGSFANLTPGDFKIVISGSTDRTMTSYYSYVQVFN